MVHLVVRPTVDLTNRKASLRLDALEERALLSADPLDPLTPVPLAPDVVAPVPADTNTPPAPDVIDGTAVPPVDPATEPVVGPTTDAPAGSGTEYAPESAPAAGAEDEYVWVPVWFYALDVGIWVDDEATTEPPVPTSGTEQEQDGTEQPTAPPADDEEGETFPIAAATDGPATNPPATPPAAPPATSGNQAYDWFLRRMGDAAPQPTQPNQSTQQPVDWLARISDPNDPLGRSFNAPELPPLGGDKPLRLRFVQVVPARDPFALDENLRTLNALTIRASGQTFDWDRIDYWAKRDAEGLRPQLDLAVRVGTVAVDVFSIGTEIGVGVATFEFGGFVLVAHGFDRAVARIESLRTGTPQMSLTADYLFHRGIGMSKADATAADDLAGDLLPLGALGVRGVVRWVKAPGAPASGTTGAMGAAGGADVVPVRPGMAGPAGRYNPPADVVAFGKKWEEALNTAVGNRMKAVGVPEEMIGVKGMPYEDPGAFVRSHAIGGSNNNIPGRGIVGSGPGINVDIAVLDARFTQMSKVKSWESASLKDRIVAVIAHEYTEVLATKPTGGLTPHQYAIKNAPETPLKISDRAREILREYRRIEGLE